MLIGSDTREKNKMKNTVFIFLMIFLLFPVNISVLSQNPAVPPGTESLVRVVDLNIGEDAGVLLSDGTFTRIRVTGIEEIRESVTKTLMGAVVKAVINGEKCELRCGSYRLPVIAGSVQVDVPVVAAYMKDSHIDWWFLKKDVRIRLWPAGSPWIEPGTFVYPVRQKWLASGTHIQTNMSHAGQPERYIIMQGWTWVELKVVGIVSPLMVL